MTDTPPHKPSLMRGVPRRKRRSRREQYLEAVRVLKAKGIIPLDEPPVPPSDGPRLVEDDQGPGAA